MHCALLLADPHLSFINLPAALERTNLPSDVAAEAASGKGASGKAKTGSPLLPDLISALWTFQDREHCAVNQREG